MLRKLTWLLILPFLTACASLPFKVVSANEAAETAMTQPRIVSTCPDPCPACPQPVCPQPVCPEPIWPTCPAIPPTEESPTPEITVSETPSLTATHTTPTRTPTFTITPTITKTSTQTWTPTLTNTPTPAPLPYSIQPETPVYLQNFAHPDKGCNWMGVAGQVFDKSGKPINQMVVIVSGRMNNKDIDLVGMTGLNSAYGPGGYEITIGNSAVVTTNALSITLYDLSGAEMTKPFTFSTYSDCSKNLVVINFNQR